VALSRTDSSFLLPAPPASAVLLPGAGPEWSNELEAQGVTLLRLGDPMTPELVVCSGAEVAQALATDPGAVIVEGADAGHRLRAAGLVTRRFLPLPSVDAPAVLLPLDQPAPARYALLEWLTTPVRWKRTRNCALAWMLEAGWAPPFGQRVTIGVREPGLPFLLARSVGLGVPPNADFLLAPGQGDRLSRGVFLVFERGAKEPRLALKFSRVRGHREPFDGDERALRLVEEVGPPVAEHAPALAGRAEIDGREVLAESAAVGRRLIGYLHSSASRARKRATIEVIPEWLVEVAGATAAPPATLGPELDRLNRDVVPAWTRAGAPEDLVARLSEMRAVLQHNDLGSWNIIVGRQGFRVLDWESARRHGLPCWDLWYFLADALAQLDGASEPEERERHFAKLFRGELATSRLLFKWTRTMVEACAVPAESVGALATLCFCHHGLSHVTRISSLRRYEPGAAPVPALAISERLARRWLTEPELGAGWVRWAR